MHPTLPVCRACWFLIFLTLNLESSPEHSGVVKRLEALRGRGMRSPAGPLGSRLLAFAWCRREIDYIAQDWNTPM